MGKRKGSVFTQFEPATRDALAFLTEELGFDGPLAHQRFLRTLTYSRPRQRITVYHDPQEQSVFASVTTVREGVEYSADLSALVFAAGLGHRNAVTAAANNLRMMDKSLESQAHYLRLLTTTLQDPAQAAELMRVAGAKQRLVPGDAQRRPIRRLLSRWRWAP